MKNWIKAVCKVAVGSALLVTEVITNVVRGLTRRCSKFYVDLNTSYTSSTSGILKKAKAFISMEVMKQLAILAVSFVLAFCVEDFHGDLIASRSMVTSCLDSPKAFAEAITNRFKNVLPSWIT